VEFEFCPDEVSVEFEVCPDEVSCCYGWFLSKTYFSGIFCNKSYGADIRYLTLLSPIFQVYVEYGSFIVGGSMSTSNHHFAASNLQTLSHKVIYQIPL
jgi:hypothetical protein